MNPNIYITTVKGKGIYNKQWTSRLSSVRVKLNIKTGKMIIIKKYGQKKTNDKNGEWIYPWFTNDEMKLLKQKAYWNHDVFINKNIPDNFNEDRKETIVHNHKQELCERCIELGYYCKYRSI